MKRSKRLRRSTVLLAAMLGFALVGSGLTGGAADVYGEAGYAPNDARGEEGKQIPEGEMKPAPEGKGKQTPEGKGKEAPEGKGKQTSEGKEKQIPEGKGNHPKGGQSDKSTKPALHDSPKKQDDSEGRDAKKHDSQIHDSNKHDPKKHDPKKHDPKKHRERKKQTYEHFLKRAAAILQMEQDALVQELKDGKSIADVAKEKGVAAETLVGKLVDQASQKIDEAVKQGKLDADKAKQIKEKMEERIKRAVEHKGLPVTEGRWKQGGGAIYPYMERFADIIGISEEELVKQLEAGKSLAEIAKARGIGREQLLEKLQNELKPSLEKLIDFKPEKRGPRLPDKH